MLEAVPRFLEEGCWAAASGMSDMSAGSRRVRTAGPGGPAESENVGAETPGVRRLSGFGLGHIICMRIFGDF